MFDVHVGEEAEVWNFHKDSGSVSCEGGVQEHTQRMWKEKFYKHTQIFLSLSSAVSDSFVLVFGFLYVCINRWEKDQEE